jgi:heat shock protein HslJ
MKTILYPMSFLFFLCAVQTHMANAQAKSISNGPASSAIYFKANGVDPLWTLTISQYQVDFRTQASGFEPFSAPHMEPIKAMDSNIKLYRLHSGTAEMEVELAQMLCQNENSRERFPYAITIALKESGDTTATYFTGCGLYVTDSDLSGRWVLEQLKGDSVFASQFNDTLPYLQLHANGNSFSGYGGCNTINGRLYSERSLLRFTDMVLSRRPCATKPEEDKFINALQFSTQFVLEGDKLVLSNPGGRLLVFRRAD